MFSILIALPGLSLNLAGYSTDRVYIIESPSAGDLFEGRKEGDALFHALKLAGMDVIYRLATNHDTFKQAVLFIIHDFYKKSGKWSAMPFIHVSAHGSDLGLTLTNGDHFTWNDFRECLQDINRAIGYVPHFDAEVSKKISRIVLCLSTCNGYNAYRIHVGQEPCPFQAIVGPTADIEWADSLTAFIAFYHNVNYKSRSFAESVRIMNISAGIQDIFQLYVTPEMNTEP